MCHRVASWTGRFGRKGTGACHFFLYNGWQRAGDCEQCGQQDKRSIHSFPPTPVGFPLPSLTSSPTGTKFRTGRRTELSDVKKLLFAGVRCRMTSQRTAPPQMGPSGKLGGGCLSAGKTKKEERDSYPCHACVTSLHGLGIPERCYGGTEQIVSSSVSVVRSPLENVSASLLTRPLRSKRRGVLP
jgi:hypothetical protein